MTLRIFFRVDCRTGAGTEEGRPSPSVFCATTDRLLITATSNARATGNPRFGATAQRTESTAVRFNQLRWRFGSKHGYLVHDDEDSATQLLLRLMQHFRRHGAHLRPRPESPPWKNPGTPWKVSAHPECTRMSNHTHEPQTVRGRAGENSPASNIKGFRWIAATVPRGTSPRGGQSQMFHVEH